MTNTLWCSFFGTICCYHRRIISKLCGGIINTGKYGVYGEMRVYTFEERIKIEELGTCIAFYSKLSSVLTVLVAFPDPLISTVMVTISLGCTHIGFQLS